MVRKTSRLRSIVVFTAMVATGGVLANAAAQKASVPKPQDKLALGQEEVKKLLLIMEPNKNGRISKQEYMRFMEAEFERLDKDKNGELDVKKLTQSGVTASRFVGK
jgi:Ca2+-binding EF-hand superfamily protein